MVYIHRRTSHQSKRDVEMMDAVAFIDDDRNNIESNDSNNGEETEIFNKASNLCYKLNSNGYKWKKTEPFIVDPTNDVGLDSNFIIESVRSGVNEWNGQLSNKNKFFRLENMRIERIDGIDTDSPNGNNEMIMGYLDDDSVIAVTITWGLFNGPISQREIVEWDMIFNQKYAFGDVSRNRNKMDFESIFVHEFGHVLGLGDIYSRSCNQATMYGMSSEGETNKRSLAQADSQGIKVLYNERS